MEELTAKFILEEQDPMKATFKIDVTPTKLSELDNDMGFVTKDEVITPDFDLSNYATKDELEQGLDNKQDILVAGNNIDINNNTISVTGDLGATIVLREW